MPSNLKVSNVFYKADNKLFATEQDKQTAVNISAFGMCTVTRIACVPAVTKWDNTAENTCINTYKILTEKSTCQCAMGGIISVIDKGHGEQHAIGSMDNKPQSTYKQDKKTEGSDKNK
ncbi:PAAR-like protein [Chryseobacterium rhizoplanae]|uniref:PAAR-like protein n=1 Tax=Chryseobacterium rhizoplanae TaxID=1609531 RepID=UPI00293D6B3E|nr:PAAR-like protein [Chryseobacterium rhizoplanae]